MKNHEHDKVGGFEPHESNEAFGGEATAWPGAWRREPSEIVLRQAASLISKQCFHCEKSSPQIPNLHSPSL